MYKKLLEKLCKIKIIEAGEIVIPNSSAVAHDAKCKLGVWWYDLASNTLLFNKKAIHSDFGKFPELMAADPESAAWVKGRVFKSRGKNYILLCTYDLEEREIRLTGQMLSDLVWEIQNKSGISINAVVDEAGHLLYKE